MGITAAATAMMVGFEQLFREEGRNGRRSGDREAEVSNVSIEEDAREYPRFFAKKLQVGEGHLQHELRRDKLQTNWTLASGKERGHA